MRFQKRLKDWSCNVEGVIVSVTVIVSTLVQHTFQNQRYWEVLQVSIYRPVKPPNTSKQRCPRRKELALGQVSDLKAGGWSRLYNPGAFTVTHCVVSNLCPALALVIKLTLFKADIGR